MHSYSENKMTLFFSSLVNAVMVLNNIALTKAVYLYPKSTLLYTPQDVSHHIYFNNLSAPPCYLCTTVLLTVKVQVLTYNTSLLLLG